MAFLITCGWTVTEAGDASVSMVKPYLLHELSLNVPVCCANPGLETPLIRSQTVSLSVPAHATEAALLRPASIASLHSATASSGVPAPSDERS